jgi:hypothetical protein
MKKTTILLAFTTSIALIGCGGGGSENNAAAPANTKATIEVTNSSPFNYASAIIVRDTDGVILHEQKMDCRSGQENCNIYYTGSEITDSVNVYFLDSLGRKFRYYNYPGLLPQYSSIDPNAWESGLYIANYIVKKYQSNASFNWSDANIRLDNFFRNYDSIDQTPDNFQELGNYYELKLKTTRLNEREIVDELVSRLKKWDVATIEEIKPLLAANSISENRFMAWFKFNFSGKNQDLIPSAHAQIANCPSGLGDFLSFAGTAFQVIPVAGDFMAAGMGIGEKLCDGTDDTLQQILSLLRDLQAGLNNVGLNVTILLSNQLDKDIATKYNDLAMMSGQLPTSPQDFTNLEFIQSQYTNVRKGHASLESLFKAKGGWQKTIDEGGKNLTDFLYFVEKENGILTKLNHAATWDNGDYYKYMVQRCQKLNASVPGENFISVRAKCNLILNANVAYVLATQRALEPMIKDIYSVLNTYQNELYGSGKTSKVSDSFKLLYGASNFADMPAAVRKKFDADMTTMISDIKRTIGGYGYFKAYAGINQKLIDNMVARDCNWTGQDKTALPAISGWFVMDTLDKNNYYVTHCRNGSSVVKARYFYTDQGSVADPNEVSNVLGVLVAEAYTSKDGYYMYDNSSKQNTYVLKKPSDSATTKPNSTGVTVTGGNGEYARWTQDTPVVRTAGRGPNSAIDGVWSPNPFNSISYSCNAGAACRYNYNWLSFKDSDDFNYVIYYWAGGAWYGTNNPAGSATGMTCMTYDCEVVDNYTKVKFKNLDLSVDLR